MKKVLRAFLVLFFVYLLASGALAWFATSTYKPAFPMNTAMLGFAVEEVEFTTQDRLKIRGWYSRGEPNAPAIILVHGFRGIRTDLNVIARALTYSGFDLLLYDSRGCGQSDGNQTLGKGEALDLKAAIEFLQKERPHHPRRIGIVGIGTGASAAILAYDDVSSLGGVALLAPYAQLDESIEERFRSSVGMHAAWMSAAAKEFIGLRIGRRARLVRPIDCISKLAPCPVLLVSAGDDAKTPPEEVKKLYEAASEPKELYPIPGITRERLTDLGGCELKRRLLDFFNSTLR